MIPMITGYVVMIGKVYCRSGRGKCRYPFFLKYQHVACLPLHPSGPHCGLYRSCGVLIARHPKQAIGQYDSSVYDAVVLMVVESALPYTIFTIVFIVAFAMQYNSLSSLCFQFIGKVQVSRRKRSHPRL